MKDVDHEKNGLKATIKAGSLMGSKSGPMTLVESDENGKIIRVRPFDYTKVVDVNTKNIYSIEAHGDSFSPPTRSRSGMEEKTQSPSSVTS